MTLTESAEGDSVRSLAGLADTVRDLLGDEAGPDTHWERRLRNLESQQDATLRVALVGAVKSGKSTLANALIGRDLLKRGAGIITSLVTRVRPGPKLRAQVELKGWGEVNREVTDAALLLGVTPADELLDLRVSEDRETLLEALEQRAGEEMFGDGGFIDRNVAILRAYLDGYARVKDLVADVPRTVAFEEAEFGRHQEFCGHESLAAYVDDLLLEIPELPFDGAFEIADCQGYDSPNPRHMEKVQAYLMGAHLVLYVLSSRVGLRQADLRFLRDVRAMGLVDSTRFVLNVDLGEHATAAEVTTLRDRVAVELRPLAGEPSIYTLSALRALLTAVKLPGHGLSRKDELMLELWEASSAVAEDAPEELTAFLRDELGPRRQARLARAREAAVRSATASLRARVDAALLVAGKEARAIQVGGQALRQAREQVQRSLASFESTLTGVGETLKKEIFRQVDAAFHPSGGSLATEVLEHLRILEPPPELLEGKGRKALLQVAARLFQEMRAALHRYKVEVVNPKAVERIRAAWAEAGQGIAAAASPQTELLIHSVESYRAEAQALHIELPPLDLPPLDPAIGRRPIALFSAVGSPSEVVSTERLVALAGQWTRNFAFGWAGRLTGRKERRGVSRSVMADGVEAVRGLLAEETRSHLLHYNEQVKYQVLGGGLDELIAAWGKAYRETVEALVFDLDGLVHELDRAGADREDLIPRLKGVRDALEPRIA